jgi:hypothetical protein
MIYRLIEVALFLKMALYMLVLSPRESLTGALAYREEDLFTLRSANMDAQFGEFPILATRPNAAREGVWILRGIKRISAMNNTVDP